MIWRAAACFLIATTPAMAAAQVMPLPSGETPRIQTARWIENQPIKLMVLPQTTITVMLEPGEAITRVTLTGNSEWDVNVSNEADALQITPRVGAEPASLFVQTDRRQYDFDVEAGEGLMAAYLVRLDYSLSGSAPPEAVQSSSDTIENLNWSYRVRGDRTVRPATIRDNGRKTVITYAPGQPLPAVFAIGATGDEEVVDGYMREGAFVIDRVHSELVFRIDKEKATARRNSSEDARP